MQPEELPRTPEERLQHRKLVSELKENAEKVPSHHFFIRKGEVCSEPKRVIEAPTTPGGPRNLNEAQIMRLKAANKPIPPELLNQSLRRKKQTSSSEESDSE